MYGLFNGKKLVVFIPSQLVMLVNNNTLRFKNKQHMRKKYEQYTFWGFQKVSREFARQAL